MRTIPLAMPSDDHPFWEELQEGVKCRSVSIQQMPDGVWQLAFDATGADLLHDHLMVMGCLMALQVEEWRDGLSEPQRRAKEQLENVLGEVLPSPLGKGNSL